MRGNWANHKFLWQDGYGRMGRGFVRALNRMGHAFYPFTLEEMDMPAWFQQVRGLDFSHVTVQLCPPHNMRHLPGRSIGFSMHESLTLPKGWADHVNQKTQGLLVPSPWLIALFQKAGVKVPIEVVPGGIDPDECPVLSTRVNQSRPYTFGCLADRAGRKGDTKVFAAFYKAFKHDNRNVRLLMKCRPGGLPNLDYSYSSDPRLTVWRADVDQVSDIYAQMDAFMFPSHCEGFGMPPRESAACGVPTVVTRWSGTADDADQWAIPLEKFTMVESGMEGCGGLWAEPDLDELVWQMRDLVEHQDDYKARALTAAQWMRDNATYRHAAEKLTAMLSRWLGGPPPAIATEASAFAPDLKQNAEAIAAFRGSLSATLANGRHKAGDLS